MGGAEALEASTRSMLDTASTLWNTGTQVHYEETAGPARGRHAPDRLPRRSAAARRRRSWWARRWRCAGARRRRVAAARTSARSPCRTGKGSHVRQCATGMAWRSLGLHHFALSCLHAPPPSPPGTGVRRLFGRGARPHAWSDVNGVANTHAVVSLPRAKCLPF